MLVFATAREEVRSRWLPLFSTGSVPLVTVSDWRSLLALVVASETRAVVVDAGLEGLRPELLVGIAASVGHRPVVRVVEEPREGMVLLPPRSTTINALLRRVGARNSRLSVDTRNRLRWSGLGARPMQRLVRAAGARRPVLVIGERGTGKEHIARALHAVVAPSEPFVVTTPDAGWVPSGPSGTLYLESAHVVGDLAAWHATASQAGWRFVAGARSEPPISSFDPVVFRLQPLRERPEHFEPLLAQALASHAQRLGLPRRRFDRALVARLRGWHWPGNERELDRFVADALDAADEPVVSADHLPDALLSRLDPRSASAAAGLEGFEEVVAARLAPVVQGWHAAGGTDLHALVADALDRALLRLALARTHGSRKAAARLLGLARNTLGARLVRLGVTAEPG